MINANEKIFCSKCNKFLCERDHISKWYTFRKSNNNKNVKTKRISIAFPYGILTCSDCFNIQILNPYIHDKIEYNELKINNMD